MHEKFASAGIFLCLALAGCAATPLENGTGFWVLSGTITEAGPEPRSRSVCDLAPPSWSWSNGEIFAVKKQMPELRVAAAITLRFDQIDAVWDDGCWSPSISYDVQPTIAEYNEQTGEREIIDAIPFEEGLHSVEGQFRGTRHEATGKWEYRGTVLMESFGTWQPADVKWVDDWQDLPHLNWDYNGGGQ